MQQILNQRCVSCHAENPTYVGFAQAPKGVMLQNAEQVNKHVIKIGETVASGYMPLANLTNITDEERMTIAKWVAQGGKVTE